MLIVQQEEGRPESLPGLACRSLGTGRWGKDGGVFVPEDRGRKTDDRRRRTEGRVRKLRS
jgi:hypothetical protein